jgi:transcriptional regulator with GAF, ATPase, and Fis domain
VVERVGGRRPIPIDMPVITATNKSLEEEMAHGRFRADLYYRLQSNPSSHATITRYA